MTIGGSLVGRQPGATVGESSAEIYSATAMGAVKIGGSIIGGDIVRAGHIFAGGPIAKVTIGGSLLGGFNNETGEIRSESAIGPVKIGGDIVGGLAGAATPGGSGYIEGKRIASLFVGGSIRAGDNYIFGGDRSGSVRAADDIGAITIKGSLLGFPDDDNDPSNGGLTRVIIAARGQADLAADAKSDVVIKSISIGGRVEFAATGLRAISSPA